MSYVSFYARVERFLFAPKGIDLFFSWVLLPISLLYCTIVWLRFVFAKPRDLGIPVVSVGNLIVGGSGKTPVTIALAQAMKHPAVVLRGYGRHSRGTLTVSCEGVMQATLFQSGDEAMLLAKSLKHATIIVAENRIEGILRAKSLGAEVVFLDDGYSKHGIKKLDLILDSAHPKYTAFCLPSGPYREKLWWGKKAHILIDGKDFTRETTLLNPTSNMLLVTAISKPWRLDAYIPAVCEKVYFPDHYAYKQDELKTLQDQHHATSILTTQKDAVKMADFGLPLSILELNIVLDATITALVLAYIQKESSCKKK